MPGEHTFGELLSGRTSYGLRDKAPDFVGTQTGLWAICAGVYLALDGTAGHARGGGDDRAAGPLRRPPR